MACSLESSALNRGLPIGHAHFTDLPTVSDLTCFEVSEEETVVPF